MFRNGILPNAITANCLGLFGLLGFWSFDIVWDLKIWCFEFYGRIDRQRHRSDVAQRARLSKLKQLEVCSLPPFETIGGLCWQSVFQAYLILHSDIQIPGLKNSGAVFRLERLSFVRVPHITTKSHYELFTCCNRKLIDRLCLGCWNLNHLIFFRILRFCA